MTDRRGRVFELGVNLVMVFIALVVLILYLADRRVADGSAERPAIALVPLHVPETWREEIPRGLRMGADAGHVTIIEFMDLECEYCAGWAARVDSLLHEFPDDVTIVIHHYPLEAIHPHAVAGAIAVECAHRQGIFPQMLRAVYEMPELLRQKRWSDLAIVSSTPDAHGFIACMDLPAESFPRIAYGVDLGRQTGVRGTPTVWVNGVIRRPSLDELRRLVLEGQSGSGS